MELNDAMALIRDGVLPGMEKQVWADLGCGEGRFTTALAELLPRNSTIHALDLHPNALKAIPESYHDVSIMKWALDFLTDLLPFDKVDGLLMANSIHFVEDKTALIQKLEAHMDVNTHLLVVEYDTDTASRWIPFPISWNTLAGLFRKNGYSMVRQLARHRSVYGHAPMYSALAKK